MKIVEIYLRIKKIMKMLEIHARILKAMKILEIFREKHNNHEHSRNQCENLENDVILTNSFENLRKS